MGTFYTNQKPLTFEENQKRGLEYAKKYGEFQPITDLWDGITDENLLVMGAQELLDNSNFQPDENYNYKEDPQLKGYDAIIDQFMFSNSAAETTALLEEMKHNAQIQKESPWYFAGRLVGAITDPSTYFAWKFKAARGALAFGSALTIEEIAKQNLDPYRADDMVPMVATAGYVIPAVLNKFTSPIPSKVADDAVALDTQWNKSATPKITTKVDETGATKIYEDGMLVDAHKLDAPPSGVGAEGIKSNVRSSPIKRMEGEQFVKSNLRIMGEDGPWTPVFRVVKASSLTAKKMMGDILDTPLLKIKNTKAQDWTASTGSIETKMKVMKVDELEAHMAVKNKYLEYISRVQGENAVPKGNLGMALHNKLTPQKLSLDEFSREVSKARIMKRHDIKEVDAAARIYGEKVYDKLWKEIDELGIREMPIQKELTFFETQLKNLRAKKESVVEFTEPSTKTKIKYSISEIEARVKDLQDLLARVKSGGKVDNYINRIYLKDAINANKQGFREILINNNKRQGITMNSKALDELIEDLSNYFPFQRFEKTPWKQWLDEWEAFGKGGVKG